MGKINAAPGASVDTAVAASTRTVLLKLMPTQQQAIEADYEAALKLVPDGQAKRDGIAVGEQAATACLARPDEGLLVPDTYRPHAAPGVYVPTMPPAVPNWGKRKPWVMTSGSQFRPGPPPALTSQTWVRDYNEIKAVGGKNSTQRTPSRPRWPSSGRRPRRPSTGRSRARSPRAGPRRDRERAPARHRRDGHGRRADRRVRRQVHYNFWRPVTAIRNGDARRQRRHRARPGWTPFIDTPMHPEYPCAHCIVSARSARCSGRDRQRRDADAQLDEPVAPGAPRSWKTVADFVQEVARPASTTACTTGTRLKSARRWASRSASSR
jgi:hypothetical protein